MRGLLLWAATQVAVAPAQVRWRWPQTVPIGSDLESFDAYKENELVMAQLKAVSLMGMKKEILFYVVTASF